MAITPETAAAVTSGQQTAQPPQQQAASQPAQASPQNPTASTQAPAQAAAPGSAAPQADASADASKGSGASSIVKGILFGALKGAAKVGSSVGGELNTIRQNSPYGQELQANKLARSATQQEMTLKANNDARADQKAQQEQVAAMDEHTTQQLMHNSLSMAQVQTAFDNHMANDKVMGEVSNANNSFLSDLEAQGISHEDVKNFDKLHQTDAKGITNGTLTPVAGMDAGGGHGLHLFNTDDLKSQEATTPITIQTGYKVVDGELKPTSTQTFPAGTNLYDAWMAHSSELKKGQTLFAQYQQGLVAKESAAKAAHEQGEAAAQNADAVEKKSAAALNYAMIQNGGGALGGAGGGSGATVPAFSKALQDALDTIPPEGKQALNKFPAQTQAMFIRAAHGFINPNTFSASIRKGGMGMTAAQAKSIMVAINPNYSDGLYSNVQNTMKSFAGDGKEGQGIRSFNQFLVHGQELKHVSEQVQRTGSPYLNTSLNELSSKYLGQPGVPELMTAVAAARREWQAFINSGYAPDTDMAKNTDTLMNDKSTPSQIMAVLGVMGTQAVGRLDQLNETYKTATGEDYPNLITPSGRSAANELGLGNQIQQYKTGGTVGGGVKPQQQVPAGAGPVMVDGKTVGYQTAEQKARGTYTAF